MHEREPLRLDAITMPETSMLVTNEILARRGVGRYGVAAELLDMAVTKQLRIHTDADASVIHGQRSPGFTLEYAPTDPPQADDNQSALLQIIFDKKPEPGDTVSFAQLSERENLIPRIDKLQSQIRKSLTQGDGDERYYGMDPLRFEKLRLPVRLIGGLILLGMYAVSNKAANFEAPFVQIGGWAGGLLLTAFAYSEIFSDLDEKLGIQSRARDFALPELQRIQNDIVSRYERTSVAPASQSEKNAYANDPAVQVSYQRALALTLPLRWHDWWLSHFCKVSAQRPDWFMSAKGEHSPESFRSDMRNFIDCFHAVFYPSPRPAG